MNTNIYLRLFLVEELEWYFLRPFKGDICPSRQLNQHFLDI